MEKYAIKKVGEDKWVCGVMRLNSFSDWRPRWSKELTFGDEEGCSTFIDENETKHLLDLLKRNNVEVIVAKYEVTQEYKLIDRNVSL